ncbi:hypothetical protein GCM10007285_23470 [Stappia taiwanensis]|nr:hypothetical protein GCM10007285_23470 [Stappia taiwanensis]
MVTMTTPNLALPLIASSQAQKHVTHNEALRALDALVQLSVRTRSLGAPPATPQEGARYIVAPAASGAWAGAEGAIAAFQDGSWSVFAPAAGWRAWVEDEAGTIVWDGTQWREVTANPNPANRVGVNTLADAVNKLAVKSDAVLFSHDDVTPGSGDIRQVLNKQAPERTAALVFQTGYGGRAEIGTAGGDDLAVKVSPDGGTWHEALRADRHSGAVSIPVGLSDIGGFPTAGIRNLCINGDMSIWQRGATGLDTRSGYKADQWRVFDVGADSSGTIERSDEVPAGQGLLYSMAVDLTALGSADWGIRQYLEPLVFKRFEGKQVTLSLWVKGPVGAQAKFDVKDQGQFVSFTGGWQRIVNTQTIPAGPSSWFGLLRQPDMVGRYLVTGVQVELGKVATPFEFKHPALDLALCRRYYRVYATSRDPADLAGGMRVTPVQSGSGPYAYSAEI